MREEVGAILLGREQHEVGHALAHHGCDLSEVIGAALDGRGRSCGAEQDRSVMAHSSASSLSRCRPDPALTAQDRSQPAQFAPEPNAAISRPSKISPDERAFHQTGVDAYTRYGTSLISALERG